MGWDSGPQLVAERTERARLVRDVFTRIAPVYDRGNALLSLGFENRWRAAAVAKTELRPGDTALDLCCGTGSFLPHLRRAVGNSGTLLGLDVCLPMLGRVGTRRSGAGLVLADACRVPVASATVDAVTIGWGLRNVPDLRQCLEEAGRVLRPGGRLVSLDMAHSRGAPFAACTLMARLVGGILGQRSAYCYLAQSTAAFASPEELEAEFSKVGLRGVGHRRMFFGLIAIVWGAK